MMSKKSSRGGRKRSSNRGGYSYNKQPVPDEMCVTLRYADSDDVTATVGSFTWQFRGNGPFDPDVTFVGVQPPAYDQWSALYSRYTVESSSITVRAISRSVSNCMRIAVGPAASTVSVPAFDALAGFRYAVSKDTTGGAQAAVLSLDLTTAQVFGCPQSAVDSSVQAGFDSSTANTPSREWYWNLAIETSGSSDAISLYVVVTYRVRFWQPVVQTVSLSRPIAAPRLRRALGTKTEGGLTATAEPEKPTEPFGPRGGSLVSDPVIHSTCPCRACGPSGVL